LLVLTAAKVRFRYPGREKWALEGVSCLWKEGESVLLCGPAGSGKSTLGRLLKGLYEPTAGSMAIGEEGSTDLACAAELLHRVGWADAQPERQIFASTVLEEVAFGPRQRKMHPADVHERTEWALGALGLDSISYGNRNPMELSGGERRRVAIAGAIATPSKFVILDEPAAGLDAAGLAQVRDLIWKLNEAVVGTLVITHDPDDFRDLADSVWVMDSGKLVRKEAANNVNWAELDGWLERGMQVHN
jgi:energy-coupling factor transporter ATP-binding protein EcfA2